MSALAHKRAPRRRQPVYLRLREMIEPETGEVRAAFVAADAREREVLRTRKYHLGDVLRADIHKPRNPKHHRLAMATIALLVEHVEGIDTIEQALTIAKVGMGYCDPVIDGGTGKTLWVMRSIAFDAMDETEFSTFHRDLCRFIAKRYLPNMTPEQVADMAQIMEGTAE